jgi:hypothetical protein
MGVPPPFLLVDNERARLPFKPKPLPSRIGRRAKVFFRRFDALWRVQAEREEVLPALRPFRDGVRFGQSAAQIGGNEPLQFGQCHMIVVAIIKQVFGKLPRAAAL